LDEKTGAETEKKRMRTTRRRGRSCWKRRLAMKRRRGCGRPR